jgi:hypothetical protein
MFGSVQAEKARTAAQTRSSPPTEALAGLVEQVTFHNAESGFCVLRVKARGHRDLVTVVGHAAAIAAGEWVQLAGTWTQDRVHGRRHGSCWPTTDWWLSVSQCGEADTGAEEALRFSLPNRFSVQFMRPVSRRADMNDW